MGFRADFQREEFKRSRETRVCSGDQSGIISLRRQTAEPFESPACRHYKNSLKKRAGEGLAFRRPKMGRERTIQINCNPRSLPGRPISTARGLATNALDEKSKLEKALQTIQIAQGDQKFNTTQDVTELENTMSNLKCQFEKTLQDSTASQKSLEENLVSTKHDLLKVQDQLALAEKELEKKFQQTAAYRNMKEILSKKNDQIKELRKKLSKYEPDD